MSKPTISIIIPLFNEETLLQELTQRIHRMIQNNTECLWEVLYINDGSSDSSNTTFTQLTQMHSWLKVLHLSRNFGHQKAITAGLDYANGDAVIVMDGDLQDPPELIPNLIEKWQHGFDVVYATRKDRSSEPWIKRFTASLFYTFLKQLSKTSIPIQTGDFRLMSRPVVQALKTMREQSRFLRGMVSWAGFSQTAIYYDRPPRLMGKTKYTFSKMIQLALDGFFSFSTRPLQWITQLGFLISGASFIGIILVFYEHLVLKTTIIGWSSLMVTVLFLGGIQLICLGIIGEYLGRIFDESRHRPLYLIKHIEHQGCSTDSPSTKPQPQLVGMYQ